MSVRKRIVSVAALSLILTAGISVASTMARADDDELFAYLMQEYGREPQIDIPTEDRFDITRFLGQPDPYVPEPYRWSWQERYFFDGSSPVPWFSIPWPLDSWRGPF